MKSKILSNNKQIPSIWSNVYPETTPIIHVQTDKLKYYLRLHWLPNSKQYPENNLEYTEIEERLIKLIASVFGEKNNLKCVITLFNSDVNFFESNEEIKKYISQELEIKNIQIHESINLGKQEDLTNFYDDDIEHPALAKFIVTESALEDTHFAKIINSIVHGNLFNILFMCEGKPSVVALYEGGFDIFVSSEQEKQELKVKFKDWLPKRSM